MKKYNKKKAQLEKIKHRKSITLISTYLKSKQHQW